MPKIDEVAKRWQEANVVRGITKGTTNQITA